MIPSCCNELAAFVNALKGVYLEIGEGEISGSVSLEVAPNEPNKLVINDGWNGYPDLTFHYCPYCGTKQI